LAACLVASLGVGALLVAHVLRPSAVPLAKIFDGLPENARPKNFEDTIKKDRAEDWLTQNMKGKALEVACKVEAVDLKREENKLYRADIKLIDLPGTVSIHGADWSLLVTQGPSGPLDDLLGTTAENGLEQWKQKEKLGYAMLWSPKQSHIRINDLSESDADKIKNLQGKLVFLRGQLVGVLFRSGGALGGVIRGEAPIPLSSSLVFIDKVSIEEKAPTSARVDTAATPKRDAAEKEGTRPASAGVDTAPKRNPVDTAPQRDPQAKININELLELLAKEQHAVQEALKSNNELATDEAVSTFVRTCEPYKGKQCEGQVTVSRIDKEYVYVNSNLTSVFTVRATPGKDGPNLRGRFVFSGYPSSSGLHDAIPFQKTQADFVRTLKNGSSVTITGKIGTIKTDVNDYGGITVELVTAKIVDPAAKPTVDPVARPPVDPPAKPPVDPPAKPPVDPVAKREPEVKIDPKDLLEFLVKEQQSVRDAYKSNNKLVIDEAVAKSAKSCEFYEGKIYEDSFKVRNVDNENVYVEATKGDRRIGIGFVFGTGPQGIRFEKSQIDFIKTLKSGDSVTIRGKIRTVKCDFFRGNNSVELLAPKLVGPEERKEKARIEPEDGQKKAQMEMEERKEKARLEEMRQAKLLADEKKKKEEERQQRLKKAQDELEAWNKDRKKLSQEIQDLERVAKNAALPPAQRQKLANMRMQLKDLDATIEDVKSTITKLGGEVK